MDRFDGTVHIHSVDGHVFGAQVRVGHGPGGVPAERRAPGTVAVPLAGTSTNGRRQRDHPRILFDRLERLVLAGADGLRGHRPPGVQTDGVENRRR